MWQFRETLKTTQNWPIPRPKSWFQRCFRSRNDFFELRLQSLAICDFEVAAVWVTKVVML